VSEGRQPGPGKYARAERERRWLVACLPADATEPRRVEDRYLDGTRLRLRRVEDAEGVVFKLGQKIRADAGDPFLVWITNLYLTAQEYQRLAVLPAAVLVKTRRLVRHGTVSFAVDEFGGPLQGLLLAETELAESGGLRGALPSWLGPEVTHDDRYSGATLAREGRPPAEDR
jgi:CYTH domain-containing protein